MGQHNGHISYTVRVVCTRLGVKFDDTIRYAVDGHVIVDEVRLVSHFDHRSGKLLPPFEGVLKLNTCPTCNCRELGKMVPDKGVRKLLEKQIRHCTHKHIPGTDKVQP